MGKFRRRRRERNEGCVCKEQTTSDTSAKKENSRGAISAGKDPDDENKSGEGSKQSEVQSELPQCSIHTPEK